MTFWPPEVNGSLCTVLEHTSSMDQQHLLLLFFHPLSGWIWMSQCAGAAETRNHRTRVQLKVSLQIQMCSGFPEGPKALSC